MLRTLEKIDDDAGEFGVHLVKINDRLMAKKYGIRNPPGLVYFRKGKFIMYEGGKNYFIFFGAKNIFAPILLVTTSNAFEGGKTSGKGSSLCTKVKINA